LGFTDGGIHDGVGFSDDSASRGVGISDVFDLGGI
jgi:hypothetical protein